MGSQKGIDNGAQGSWLGDVGVSTGSVIIWEDELG